MVLPGNTAKAHIIRILEKRLAAEPNKTFRILDVGVTGPDPLNLWLPLTRFPNFELTGIDVDGPSIEKLKAGKIPAQLKTLETLSGYDLVKRFGKDQFDLVVSTQVLEHMRFPAKAIDETYAVLKRGGTFLACYDNSAYPRADDHLREWLKDMVVRVSGSERYHDKDLSTDEVRKLLTGVGFTIDEELLYCLHPMKDIHGHETPEGQQDALMDAWLRLEDLLNAQGHAVAHPERYLAAYFSATKK